MTNLWPKQERFVEEYLATANGLKAALAAGYSQKSAQTQSTRLLRDEKVSAEIASRRAAIGKKLEITVEYVVNGLRELAEGEKIPAAVKANVLTQLGKYTGGFVERHSLEVAVVHNIIDFGAKQPVIELEHVETLPEALPETDSSE